jgi:plastocyanin
MGTHTMNRLLSLFSALLLFVGSANADVVIVNQVNFAFVPQDVVINVGDTVRWVRSGGVHDVSEGLDDIIDGTEAFFGLLDSANPVFEFTFDEAFLAAHPRVGNLYDYCCTPHLNFGMIGTVTVQDVVEVAQSGTSFVPSEISVTVGQTVRWTWSGGSHTVTEGTDGSVNGNEAFHSSLNNSVNVFEVTFTEAFIAANPRTNDRYDYFCVPHFGMGMTGGVTIVASGPGTSFCSGDGSGTACPCGNTGNSGEGCANDTGSGALMSGAGSASIATDDLVLSVVNLTPGPGLFFQGNNAVNGGNGNTFGDGLRCAGGSVLRLEIRFANSGNNFTTRTTIPIAGTTGVGVGQTKRYQYWYRDAGTSPCSSLFNLSNGYEVTWGA